MNKTKTKTKTSYLMRPPHHQVREKSNPQNAHGKSDQEILFFFLLSFKLLQHF